MNTRKISRPIIFSQAGMVVSGHHRASEAGASILRAGGNALDAAIAASAALCVAVPNMNGLGGDCFALFYDAKRNNVTCINGSGAAPAAALPQAYVDRNCQSMPRRGPLPISVCGLVHAWQSGLAAFGSGRYSLAQLIENAAFLAEQGSEVDVCLQEYFASDAYHELVLNAPGLKDIFGPRAKRSLGERIPQKTLSASLRRIAEEGVETMYGGSLGRDLIDDLSRQGSLLTLDDMRKHTTRLADAPCVSFYGRRLFFAPPNSQGIALGLLAGLWEALRGGKAAPDLTPETYMRLKNIAFDLRDRYAVDPARGVRLPPQLLEEKTLHSLLEKNPPPPREGVCSGGDTSTLVVIDRWGNAVSWVQSLFDDFGSGVVSPSTGIVMHNRLRLEVLAENSPRCVQPGMRPFHTLCPALLVGDRRCEIAIATPGDHGQPQSLFQVLVNIFAKDMNIQAAIEAPRMRHDSGTDLMLEGALYELYAREAEPLGMRPVDVGEWPRLMGGLNAIQCVPEGALLSGADPRRSSYAVSA
jgi:gamma-glutamyltranspeptidase/glutathione hydrolase